MTELYTEHAVPIGNTQPYQLRQALQQELGMTAYNDEHMVYGLARPLSPKEHPAEGTVCSGQKLTNACIEIKDHTAKFSGSASSRRRIMPIIRKFESIDACAETQCKAEPRQNIIDWLRQYFR